jgi:hypothetical protein
MLPEASHQAKSITSPQTDAGEVAQICVVFMELSIVMNSH